jgi:predicted DNA-binding protein
MQDAPRDANLSLRIETELLQRLKRRAAEDDRTMAQTVRRALRQYVEEVEPTERIAA